MDSQKKKILNPEMFSASKLEPRRAKNSFKNNNLQKLFKEVNNIFHVARWPFNL
jgi:hypothetical protein